MGLGREGYSPMLLRQIVTQGGRYAFGEAAGNLRDLAGVSISAVHIDTLVHRIGSEWSAKRDHDVADFQHHELARGYAQAPVAAAVMLDAGRAQVRAESSAPGVHAPQWRSPNYACCLTLPASSKKVDPQPEPPTKFLEHKSVAKLAREMACLHGTPVTREPKPASKKAPEQPVKLRARKSAKPRKRLRKHIVRTAVATLAAVHEFAQMVAAEVYKRGLDLARFKACVCDGLPANWTVFNEVLKPLGFVPILDFLHLLVYLYAAAQAATGSEAHKWKLYHKWLRWT